MNRKTGYQKSIIVVEGNVYSGKTTLCLKLSSSTKFKIFEDHAFVELPRAIRNDADALSNQIKYLEIEVSRSEKIGEEKGYILDRSIISIFAFTYYLSTQGYQIKEFFLDVVEKLIRENRITIPDYLIYLKVSADELAERFQINRDASKATEEFYVNEEFIGIMDHFCCNLISKVGGLVITGEDEDNVLTKSIQYIEAGKRVNKEIFFQVLFSLMRVFDE